MKLDHLKALEKVLHQYDVRINIDKLKELLHPNFIEIGYSGRTYDFRAILECLLSESVSDYSVWSQDYEYIKYTKDIIQVIYQSANIDKFGNLSRYAKRTSIWINTSSCWQMKFHQATPVTAFHKLNE